MCNTGGTEICPAFPLGSNFFLDLLKIDEKITRLVTKAGCPSCKGPLYRSDYQRKPRGGQIAAAGEEFTRRFSLCCGREGCRKRATPPSVRFLGRRFYLGAAVLVASIMRLVIAEPAELREVTGIPAPTVERWGRWWKTDFMASALFIVLRGRLLPPPDEESLPRSLLEAVEEKGTAEARLVVVLRLLAPLTTSSVPDGARYLREG